MRLLTLIRHAYLRAMPPQRDPKELSAQDVDQILAQGIEDMTGKPTNHGDVEKNIAALRQRLAWLDREIIVLAETVSRVQDADPEACATEMGKLRQEKITIIQRIADLEVLLDNKN